jgi:hypothetical protein
LLPSGREVRWEGNDVVKTHYVKLNEPLPPGRTFIIEKGLVIDVLTGKRTPKLEMDDEDFKRRDRDFQMDISPDGKVVAVWKAPVNPVADAKTPRKLIIPLLATSSGKVVKTLEVTYPASDQISLAIPRVCAMRFSGPRTLAVVLNNDSDVSYRVFNVGTGEEEAKTPLPNADPDALAYNEDLSLAVGGQGREFAIASLVSGKVLCTFDVPGNEFLLRQWLTVSPDKKEVAVCGDGRLLVWAIDTGKLVYEQPLPGIPKGTELSWDPEGRGWLLARRFLFLREPRLLAWEVSVSASLIRYGRFLNHEKMLLTDMDRSYSVTVPWKEIDAALAAAQPPAKVHARPGDSVALKIEIGEIRFADKAEVAKALEAKVREVLGRGGYQVSDEASLVMKVAYSEGAGETKQVKEMGVTGRVTGQSIEDTTSALTIELLTPEGLVWRFEDIDNGTSVIYGEASAAGVRKQNFEFVLVGIDKMVVPCPLPASTDGPRLPIRTKLPGK